MRKQTTYNLKTARQVLMHFYTYDSENRTRMIRVLDSTVQKSAFDHVRFKY